MSENNRVAVVVVHGIADQKPGQTVRELARLLCHGGDGAPRFVQGELSEVLVPVAKLEPGEGMGLVQPIAPQLDGTSGKTDAARRQPGTPSGFYQQQQKVDTVVPATPAITETVTETANPEESADLGIALNDYLLERLELTEHDALYEAAKITLRRKEDNRAVDIYEMYWADLSRLGTGGLLALSTLYQLFFHLSILSADIVDQVSLSINGGRGWQFLQRMHAWMAWLMKAPSVIVQLCMLLVVVFGAGVFIPDEQTANVMALAYGIGGIVLMVLAALGWLHAQSTIGRWLKPALFLLAAIASFGCAIASLWTVYLRADMFIGTCALAAGLVGAWLVERYSNVARGVRVTGHIAVIATVLMIVYQAKRIMPNMSTIYEWMMSTGLYVFEIQLAAMLLIWAIFIVVQLVALILGLWLQRNCDSLVKASMHTARLSLVLSTGLFAILSLVLWSVISYVAGKGLNGVGYEPLIFADGYWPSADFFLDERVRGLGSFFTPLVTASALFAIAAMIVLMPSLLEELAPRRNVDVHGVRGNASVWAGRLGDWMGNWMRRLDRFLMVLVPIGAIGGGILFLAFIFQEFALFMNGLDSYTQWLASWLDYFQGETLVAAGKWLAGGALTIAALGSRFTQTFGRLRVVIDAVLDVDNYFADPPNKQPPRARIFSRYVSLLGYLRDNNYSRIVIVSHSQGTVISAELLRYLHEKHRTQEFVNTIPVSLVTVGSPLRDLYAKRFPLLYKWMGSHDAGFATAGPRAADLGVSEWVNACRSGDYVGRFIWTPTSDTARFRVATVDHTGSVEASREGDRTEFCLGAGAHTHYFSNDAIALAVEIDRLICGKGAATCVTGNVAPLFNTASNLAG